MNNPSNKFINIGYWIPLFLLLLLYTFQSYSFHIHDFANYYYGGYFVTTQSFDSNIYDALHFNESLVNLGFKNLFVSYYPNTPFLSFFYAPFSFLDWQTAKVLFNVLGCLWFCWALFRLFRYFKIDFRYLVFIPVLFFIPIKNSLLFGQPYLLLVALLAEGLLAYCKDKKIIANLFWSIGILLKVFPVLLFFFLFFKRDFKSIVYLGLSCLLLIGISIPFCGWESWEYFAISVFPKSNAGIIYDGFTPKAKSILMLFKNLFVYDAVYNPKPFIDSEVLFNIVQIAYKSLIFIACALTSLKFNKTQYQLIIPFSIWITASLLIGPTNSSYSKILLVFPMFAIFAIFKNLQKMGITDLSKLFKVPFALGLLFVMFLISNIPQSYFYDLPLLLKFPRAYLLFLFFGLFLGLFHGLSSKSTDTGFKWAVTLLFVGLFTLSQFNFFRAKEKAADYVLTNDLTNVAGSKIPILMTNYTVKKDGRLEYAYWSKNGQSKVQTDWLVADSKLMSSGVLVQSLDIVDNQIYYNDKQLTFGKDKKRLAKLINGSEIFYLSDFNRGEGFYTLRKMDF